MCRFHILTHTYIHVQVPDSRDHHHPGIRVHNSGISVSRTPNLHIHTFIHTYMCRFQILVVIVILAYVFTSVASLSRALQTYPRQPYKHYRFTNLRTRDGRTPLNAGMCLHQQCVYVVYVCVYVYTYIQTQICARAMAGLL